MNDRFEVYEEIRRGGGDAKQALLRAQSDGLDWTAQIRMLRTVYRLSLPEAKEVMVTADSSSGSLAEHQGKLLPALERAMRSDAPPKKKN